MNEPLAGFGFRRWRDMTHIKPSKMLQHAQQISPRKRPQEQGSPSSSFSSASGPAAAGSAESKKSKLEEPIRTRRGPWTPEEDELLMNLVKRFGTKKWAHIAELVPGRVGKQCRERWLNHLRTDVKKSAWSEEEDMTLIRAQRELGNRWSAIARLLPGRPENSVKNRWNSLCNRRRRFASSHGETHHNGDDVEGTSTSADESDATHHEEISPRSIPSAEPKFFTLARTEPIVPDASDLHPSPQVSYCQDPQGFVWSLYSQPQQVLLPPQQQFVLPKFMSTRVQAPMPQVMLNGGAFLYGNANANYGKVREEVKSKTGESSPPPRDEHAGSTSPPTDKNAHNSAGTGKDGLMLLAALCT